MHDLPPENMLAINDGIATRAYLAGLIDGEGSIGIKRRMPTLRNKCASPKYSVSVSVGMTDRAPIDLAADFCKAPERVRSRVRKHGYKTIYEFEVENDRATRFLLEIQPYLVGKAWQAKVALEFASLRKDGVNNRTRLISTGFFKSGVNKGSSYRCYGLSHEYIERCDALYQQLLKGSPRSGQGKRFGGAK